SIANPASPCGDGRVGTGVSPLQAERAGVEQLGSRLWPRELPVAPELVYKIVLKCPDLKYCCHAKPLPNELPRWEKRLRVISAANRLFSSAFSKARPFS